MSGADRCAVQVHIDDSVIPKLARLGDEATLAFEEFLGRVRTDGRPRARASVVLDEKWHAESLTPSADVLTWWLAPDVAYVWDVVPRGAASAMAARTQCVVDPRSGALRIAELELDLGAADGASDEVSTAHFPVRVAPADLRRLGVPDVLMPTLLATHSPAELERLRVQLPHHEPFLFGYRLLARGVPVEEAARALARLPDRSFDPADYQSALLRSIDRGRIRVLAEEADLARALEEPWSHWTTYLHPEQRAIAYRRQYAGPTKVTGGPGTGKTIVAVHRVRCLLDQEGGLELGEMPLLLTTFVTSTVHQLEQLADRLLDRRQRQRVHVIGVDRLCARMLRKLQSVQRDFTIVRGGELASRFAPLLRRRELDLAPQSAVSIWENLVLATEKRSWRAVRGLRQSLGLYALLDARRYASLLDVCRELEASLFSARETTHLLLVRELIDLLPVDAHRYKHIVVDEAQDLHPLHWRLLRRLVPQQANDMFLVGDGGQRLYRRPYALSQCGIETHNRSKVLRLSYRTSREILDFAAALLGGDAVDDLDGGDAAHSRERSVFSSPWPRCLAFGTRESELAGVVRSLDEWRREGMSWGEMMVAAPSNHACTELLAALDEEAIPGRVLQRRTPPRDDAVSIVTYYRAKGLEARAVLVTGAGGGSWSATSPPSDHDGATRMRRALYVACTRARERLTVTWTGSPNEAVASAIASGARVETEYA